MLLRRPLLAAPALSRGCAFLTKVKAMEAASTKLAPSLPEGLKEIADAGASISADLSKFASERPDLYKAVIAKIGEADKPAIRATVAEAKDPKACKYTEEGTMVHEMMQRIAISDRRMKAIADLEVTLTAADKEAIKSAQLAKAKELGFDASMLSNDFPDKMKLGM
jgi:hypothetical protein